MIKNIVFILFFLSSNLFGQINFVSKIMDEKNNKPIPFVNIYIKGAPVGVISNVEGVFQINIEEKYNENILVLSAIGFENKEINISSLGLGIYEVIKLKPNTTLLDEVVVRTKELTADEIIKRAFDNYYKNFPTQPYITKGFLRHTEKTKNEYKWMIEAAIEIYDPGYNLPSREIRTNILEVRKSMDDRILDTTDIYKLYLSESKGLSFKKAWKNAPKLTDVSRTEIQNAIIFHDQRQINPKFLFTRGINKIRYYNQKNAIFDKKILKKHTFEIDTILSYNDAEVYKIKITPASPPVKLSKKIGKYLLPIGWIYIRIDDYAIIELDYTLLNSTKSEIYTKISGSKIRSNFNIKFIDINGKMYPKYISYKVPKPFNRLRSVFKNLEDKVSNSENYYFGQQEILFSEIITDRETIENNLQKSWNDDLFNPRQYNEEFWKDYNVLLESAQQQKMIKDLEKKIKLKDQYKISN